MKKLLALGLSLAMMASLTAVAFAADNKTIVGPDGDDTPNQQSGYTVVKTETKGPVDPNPGEDESWTVTIPAEIIVPWDNETDSTSADATYSVSAKLAAQSTVTVTVVEDVVEMKNTAAEDYKLNATIGGQKEISVTATGSDSGVVNATITAVQFAAAPVGSYEGILNFNVEYTNQYA